MDILYNSKINAYSMNEIDLRSEQAFYLKVDQRWIQKFMERYRIVNRAHIGKYRCSSEKEQEAEIFVPAHLGIVYGLLSSREIDENAVENADKTHFSINVSNGRNFIGFTGNTEVKYADAVRGNEGFIMVVRFTGGRDSRTEKSFMVQDPGS